MVTIGAVLEQHRADVSAQLKPLQDFLAAQQAVKTTKDPGVLTWQDGMNKWILGQSETPKPDQAIMRQRDGSYRLASPQVLMAEGGALGIIEKPLNFWPAVPVGSILVGGIVGLTLGEVIDGLAAPKTAAGGINPVNIAVKTGALLFLGTMGSKVMSRTATIIAVGIIGVQMLADILPLDRLVAWVVGLFRRFVPGAQAMNQRVVETSGPSGFAGSQTRNDLYASIFGGG